MSAAAIKAKDIRWIPIAQIRPAPENDTLNGPIDPSDPKIQQMAAEMREHGKPPNAAYTVS